MAAAIALMIVPLLLGQVTQPSPAAASYQGAQAPPSTTAPPVAQPAPSTEPTQPQGASTAPPDASGSAERQAAIARKQSAATEERVTRVEAENAAIRAQLDEERRRTARIEQQLANEQARREEEARSPAARDRALGAATENLSGAGQTLAGGSSDVSDALVQAQSLAADAARNAAQNGSPQEAAYAAEAQRLLGASQEALQRGDLFQARQALQGAQRAAAQARGLAAAGTGAAADPATQPRPQY